MNNKITLSLLGGALMSSSAFAGEVAPLYQAEAPCYEADVAVGYHSDYIFRGSRFGRDLVDASLNVSKSLWGLDFTAGAWYGSYESTDDTNINELDLTFGASKDFGWARFNTGFISYQNDLGNDNEDNGEVYFGFSKDLVYGLSASLTYYLDVYGDKTSIDNNGYTECSLAKSDLFVEGVTLSNDLGYLIEKGFLSHNTTTLGYDWSISDNATLTPYIAYTFELDGLEEHGPLSAFDPSEQNRFHGGVVLSVNF